MENGPENTDDQWTLTRPLTRSICFPVRQGATFDQLLRTTQIPNPDHRPTSIDQLLFTPGGIGLIVLKQIKQMIHLDSVKSPGP